MKILKLFLNIILILILFICIFVYSDLKNISKYKQYTDEYSEKYGIDSILVISVIKTESDFNPEAKSNKGAIGLMQLIPATARDVYIMIYNNAGFKPELLYNPKINIRIGVCYLKVLSEKFNGNRNLVLAAYNAGPGNVKKWIEKNPGIETDPELIPFEETKKYIKKINSIYKYYAFISRFK